MQYGVSAYLWTAPFRDQDIDLIAKVAAMGFNVLEIPVWDEVPFDCSRVAQVARQRGVECVVGADMSEQADLVHPDQAVRKAGLDRLCYYVQVAEQIGARMVAGPICVASYRYWWPDEERKRRDLDHAVTGLRAAAQFAADRGISLALELLNRYETPFCTRVADGVELWEAVDHPAFGLLLDTFHLNIEEKQIGDAIDYVGERLSYLHASENDRGIPGSGHLPWQEVSGSLKRIGYDGYAVIESFVYEPDVGQAARVWHPCAADMDALARDGLAFLKGLLG